MPLNADRLSINGQINPPQQKTGERKIHAFVCVTGRMNTLMCTTHGRAAAPLPAHREPAEVLEHKATAPSRCPAPRWDQRKEHERMADGTGLPTPALGSAPQADQVTARNSDYSPFLLGWDGTQPSRRASLPTRAIFLMFFSASSSLSVSAAASATSLAIEQPRKGFSVLRVAHASAASPSRRHPLFSPLLICLAGVKY